MMIFSVFIDSNVLARAAPPTWELAVDIWKRPLRSICSLLPMIVNDRQFIIFNGGISSNGGSNSHGAHVTTHMELTPTYLLEIFLDIICDLCKRTC